MDKNKQRKAGVLLKDLDSKLALVLEGIRGVDGKVDKHYSEFNEFKQKVDYKFEEVLDELRVIRNEKVGREEFLLLEKRVLKIEKGIKTHN